LRGKTIDCKAKFVAASLREAWLEPTSPSGRRLQLLAFQRQDLAAAVIAARWTGDVRGHATPALRAFVELRSVPAVCRFPRAQSHLWCFAFWDSHGRRRVKHIWSRKTTLKRSRASRS